MRLLFSTLLFTIVALPGGASAIQTPAAQTADAATPTAVTAATADSSSGILQPALANLLEAIDSLHTDKWKAPVRLRDETDANVRSIRRDVDTVLPPLLKESDGAADSVVSGLPVLRNIEALYDVLLRVAIVGKTAAPAPQSAALDAALSKLDDARRTLGDRLQVAALAKEKQVNDLQAALRKVPPPPPPAPVVTPPPVPEKKRTPRKKVVPKPAPPVAAPAAAPQ